MSILVADLEELGNQRTFQLIPIKNPFQWFEEKGCLANGLEGQSSGKGKLQAYAFLQTLASKEDLFAYNEPFPLTFYELEEYKNLNKNKCHIKINDIVTAQNFKM